MFNPITNLVHEYDFSYSSILEPHIGDILQEYENKKKENNKELTTDLYVDSKIPVIKHINKELEYLVQKNYHVGEPMGESPLRVYIQNGQSNVSLLHDHTGGLGTICGVFYLNPPKEGGEILFKYLENTEWGFELKLKPQINKVYLFPYWLPHKPLPQKDSTPRFCFNWVYASNDRPVHKYARIFW